MKFDLVYYVKQGPQEEQEVYTFPGSPPVNTKTEHAKVFENLLTPMPRVINLHKLKYHSGKHMIKTLINKISENDLYNGNNQTELMDDCVEATTAKRITPVSLNASVAFNRVPGSSRVLYKKLLEKTYNFTHRLAIRV